MSCLLRCPNVNSLPYSSSKRVILTLMACLSFKKHPWVQGPSLESPAESVRHQRVVTITRIVIESNSRFRVYLLFSPSLSHFYQVLDEFMLPGPLNLLAVAVLHFCRSAHLGRQFFPLQPLVLVLDVILPSYFLPFAAIYAPILRCPSCTPSTVQFWFR